MPLCTLFSDGSQIMGPTSTWMPLATVSFILWGA